MEPVSAELDKDYYLCLVLVFILPYVYNYSDYVQVMYKLPMWQVAL